MDPITLMVAGGIVAIVFILATIINFMFLLKSGMEHRGFSLHNLGLHLLLPFIAGLGSLGFFVGLIMFLLEKYAK